MPEKNAQIEYVTPLPNAVLRKNRISQLSLI